MPYDCIFLEKKKLRDGNNIYDSRISESCMTELYVYKSMEKFKNISEFTPIRLVSIRISRKFHIN